MNQLFRNGLPAEVRDFAKRDGGFIVITGLPGSSDRDVNTVTRKLAVHTHALTGRTGIIIGDDAESARDLGLPFSFERTHKNKTEDTLKHAQATNIGIVVLQTTLTISSLWDVINAASAGVLVICRLNPTMYPYSLLIDLQQGAEDWGNREAFDNALHAIVGCPAASHLESAPELDVFIPPKRPS